MVTSYQTPAKLAESGVVASMVQLFSSRPMKRSVPRPMK
jgi:hypothetical protein